MFPYSFPNFPVTVWRVAVLMLAIELKKKKKCLESFSLGFRPLLKKKKRKRRKLTKKKEGSNKEQWLEKGFPVQAGKGRMTYRERFLRLL